MLILVKRFTILLSRIPWYNNMIKVYRNSRTRHMSKTFFSTLSDF